MQNQSGTGKDPMAQLDQAMAEAAQELARQGTGTSPSEVVREAPPRAAPRRASSSPDEADGGRLDEGVEERPQRARRRASRGGSERDGASQVILDEADAEGPSADERPRRPARQQDEAPQRGPDGRFLPSGRSDTDADGDDDLDDDEDDVRADGRRYAEPEEAGVVDEDDDAESEGRGRAEGDEGEGEDRRERRGRRRFPRAVRDEITRQVDSRVSKVIEERDQLRQAQAQHQRVEAEAIDTLVRAIGTQQERDRLQQIVNNPRAPLEQRNRAAATLNRYVSNETYVRTYRTALLAADRHEKAERRTAGIAHLAKYQIELDPQVVQAGDDANTMAHVARQAILAERKRAQAETDVLKRQLATRGGYADERTVRDGRFGRDSLATANGRRANGRVAQADPLRRAMGYERGLGADSQVPFPTDQVLRQLKDGDITLRDLGLDQ